MKIDVTTLIIEGELTIHEQNVPAIDGHHLGPLISGRLIALDDYVPDKRFGKYRITFERIEE